MIQDLASSIVEFLSFSPEVSCRVRLENFSELSWQRTLPWLHDAGLAFYFLKKLKDVNAVESIPPPILACLENSFEANRQRVQRVAGEFDFLNWRFKQGAVMWAAVKGLSLVPEFCPDAHLRHQSDLDYIITKESLPLARQVLERAGYSLRMHTASDYSFCVPDSGFRPTAQNQYSPDAPCPVELHLSLWNSNARDIFLLEPRFWADQLISRQWEGMQFSGLRDELQFLFQITHVFYHLSNYWVRLSWLFELSYFFHQRSADRALWTSVEQLISDDPVLSEVVGLIATLGQHFFGVQLPVTLEELKLRPEVRMWAEKYARLWAFGRNQLHNFNLWPSAKLTLFLLRQYVPDQKQFIRSRLFPVQRLARVAQTLKANPVKLLDDKYRKHERLLLRTAFHMAANLRYLCEQPRWSYRTRAAASPQP